MSAKPQLLYIDDEPSNLLVFKSVFRNDYDVMVAESAKEGLEVLKGNPGIQLIITDQRMPEMTGVEFLEVVVSEFPDPMRIVLTGYSDINDIIKAINFGKIYHYVTKPWDKTLLKVVIDKALEHYSLRKENSQLVQTLGDKNRSLKGAIDELEMFLYRSSHDLKGPISTQLGLIYLSKIETSLQKINLYIEKMEESVKKMDSTLSKLAKLNIGNLDHFYREQVSVKALVDEVLRNSQEEIDNRMLKVFLPDDFDDLNLFTNPELFKIIIESVIENAILYSRENGNQESYIKINSWKKDDWFFITVEDNGHGIQSAVKTRIFDPFFRGNENSKGNGLGLYIAKKAVEKLKGEIDVMSESNHGTTFVIRLPCDTLEVY
ncbi:MAG: ATP-binding protein [Bacteroidota bacterium]